ETERANGRGRSRGRSPHHRTRCGRTTGVHPGPTYEDAGAHGFRRLCDSRDGVAPRGTFDELTTMAGSSMNNGDQQGAVGTLNPTYTPDISQGPATCGGPDGGSLFPLTSCPGPRRPGWRPRRPSGRDISHPGWSAEDCRRIRTPGGYRWGCSARRCP